MGRWPVALAGIGRRWLGRPVKSALARTKAHRQGSAHLHCSKPQVRAILGDDVLIVCPCDHHANITARMVRHADALVGHETQPHHQFDTGTKVSAMVMHRGRAQAAHYTANHQTLRDTSLVMTVSAACHPCRLRNCSFTLSAVVSDRTPRTSSCLWSPSKTST